MPDDLLKLLGALSAIVMFVLMAMYPGMFWIILKRSAVSLVIAAIAAMLYYDPRVDWHL